MSDDQQDDLRRIIAAAEELSTARTDRFVELCDRARSESSRGLVLMIAESLNETLADLLRGVGVDKKVMKEELGWRGIFGSFAARTRAAYVFGLIRKWDLHFVDSVRALRNEAAHSHSHFSLSSPAPSTAKCLAKMPISGLRAPPQSNMSEEEAARYKLLLYISVVQGKWMSKLEILAHTAGIPENSLVSMVGVQYPEARVLVKARDLVKALDVVNSQRPRPEPAEDEDGVSSKARDLVKALDVVNSERPRPEPAEDEAD